VALAVVLVVAFALFFVVAFFMGFSKWMAKIIIFFVDC